MNILYENKEATVGLGIFYYAFKQQFGEQNVIPQDEEANGMFCTVLSTGQNAVRKD